MTIKRRILLVTLLVIQTLLPFEGFAASNLISPLNKLPLDIVKPNSNYSFFVLGHAYGAPGATMFPAGSLLAGVEKLNVENAKFGVLLGDYLQHTSVRSVADRQLAIFRKHVSDKITVPLFAVPGNHDFSNRDWYREKIGADFNIFDYGNSSFFLLNTERKWPCGLGEDQTAKVIKKVRQLEEQSEIENVFFLMHQPLWIVGNPKLEIVSPWVNGGPLDEKCGKFNDDIVKNIQNLASKASVYFVAGDVGCKNYSKGKVPIESFPVFFHKDTANNLTYVASGICGNENDNFIRITVNGDDVKFDVESFSNREWPNIETFNISYWEKSFEPQADLAVDQGTSTQSKKVVKQLFLKLASLVKNKKFILGLCLGFLASIIFMSAIRLFLRRRVTN